MSLDMLGCRWRNILGLRGGAGPGGGSGTISRGLAAMVANAEY